MALRLKKTIASLAIALTAAGAAVAWVSCAPKSNTPVPPLARLGDRLIALPSPSPAPSASARAIEQAPGVTVADVLDHPSCSTEVVKGLSEQIIAEENCLHPSTYLALPKLRSIALEDAVFPYLMQPAHDALVAALDASKSEPMTINSMLRTIAQQYLLYDWYKRGRCHIKLAATPGRSNHQSGLAIDIAQPARWKAKLTRHGFRWMGAKDRWHFDYVGKTEAEKDAAKHLSDTFAGLDVKAFQRLWNRNHPEALVPEDGAFEGPTEEALRRAPAAGFRSGVHCGQ